MIVTLEKVITVTEWGYKSDIIMIYNSDVRIIYACNITKGDNSDMSGITVTSEWGYSSDVIVI